MSSTLAQTSPFSLLLHHSSLPPDAQLPQPTAEADPSSRLHGTTGSRRECREPGRGARGIAEPSPHPQDGFPSARTSVHPVITHVLLLGVRAHLSVEPERRRDQPAPPRPQAHSLLRLPQGSLLPPLSVPGRLSLAPFPKTEHKASAGLHALLAGFLACTAVGDLLLSSHPCADGAQRPWHIFPELHSEHPVSSVTLHPTPNPTNLHRHSRTQAHTAENTHTQPNTHPTQTQPNEPTACASSPKYTHKCLLSTGSGSVAPQDGYRTLGSLPFQISVQTATSAVYRQLLLSHLFTGLFWSVLVLASH